MDATDCRAAKAALRGMGFSVRKKDIVQVHGHTTTFVASNSPQNVPALRMSRPPGFGCFGNLVVFGDGAASMIRLPQHLVCSMYFGSEREKLLLSSLSFFPIKKAFF